MRKTLTPLVVAALLIAAVVAIAPKQALAQDSPEEIAETLFGQNYESYTAITGSDTNIVIDVNAGATFQSGAEIDVTGISLTLNINASITTPENPITVSGNGNFTLACHGSITGSSVCFKTMDAVNFSIHDIIRVSGIEITGGQLQCFALPIAPMLNIDTLIVSGDETPIVTFTGDKLKIENVILSNTNESTVFSLGKGTFTNLTTEKSFAGTLKLENSKVLGTTEFSGGTVQISGDECDFGRELNVSGATVELNTTLQIPEATICGGKLVIGNGVTVNCPIEFEDVEAPATSTLELNGGTVKSSVRLEYPSSQLIYTTQSSTKEPAIPNISFDAGKIVFNANGELTETPIVVGEGCEVRMQQPKGNLETSQKFIVRGGTMNIWDGVYLHNNLQLIDGEVNFFENNGGSGNVDSVSVYGGTLNAGVCSTINHLDCVKGGTVNLNGWDRWGSPAPKISGFGDSQNFTGGTINIIYNAEINAPMALSGTNLNIDSSEYEWGFNLSNNIELSGDSELTINEGSQVISTSPRLMIKDNAKASIKGTVVSESGAALTVEGGDVTVSSTATIWGEILQTGGTLNIGEQDNSTTPTITELVTIQDGSANIVGGNLQKGINVTPSGNTRVVIGTLQPEGQTPNAPNISDPCPDESNFPYLTLYSVNGKAYEDPNPTDRAGLEAAVSEAKKIDADDYTEDSFAKLTSAIADAEKILADKFATQDDIESALSSLNAAVDALVLKPEPEPTPPHTPVDKAVLKAAVNEAKSLSAANYTANSFANLKAALAAAEAALDNDEATQAEVNAAATTLNAAIAALVPASSPTPTPPTPSQALSSAAPKIKETMADYANATYSDNYLDWDVTIEDAETPVSTLAKDLVADVLRALSSSTVRSATSGDASVALPTTQAKRQAFAMEVLANASGDADPNTTLESLYGKTVTILFKTSAGKTLTMTIDFAGAPAPDAVEVYRVLNPDTQEHLYTADPNEYRYLTQEAGWEGENVAWTAPASSGTSIYRLRHPGGGHLYTTSKVEYDYQCAHGWIGEDIAMYSAPNADSVPIYRLYNPELPIGFAHLWTADFNEYAYQGEHGWEREDVAFYAITAPGM